MTGRWLTGLGAVALYCAIAGSGWTDDSVPASKEKAAEEKGQKRAAVFKEAVKNLKVTSSVIQDPEKLTFPESPILRYNDVTRHFFDATVWKLGTKGRPTALLTMEMYGTGGGSALLMHEFTSLADGSFSVDTPLGVHRSPSDTDCLFKPLPDAPVPAKTEPLRLAQMRALARRFACDEEFGGNKQALRLLTQPLDRYRDPDTGIADGAMFAFATGTNPELILLLEAGENGWTYGLARQALAELKVTLDDQPLYTFPLFTGEGRENDYFSEPYTVQLEWDELLPRGVTDRLHAASLSGFESVGSESPS